MKINFNCPTCGHDKLTELLTNVVMDSDVSHIIEVDGECILGYENSETNLGEIDRFLCLRCGDPITDDDNNTIKTNKELFNWLKKNNMLDEDNIDEYLDGKDEIEVSIIGGVVTDIQGIPDGVKIVIKDYDCDTTDDSLEEDEDGFKYIKSVWE